MRKSLEEEGRYRGLRIPGDIQTLDYPSLIAKYLDLAEVAGIVKRLL